MHSHMLSLPDIILPKHEFFGLSIDRAAIRGIQIDRNGKMTGIAEIALPQDVFLQGNLTKIDVFQNALKALKEQGKFSTPYVVATFPEAFAYTRELHLPLVSTEELSEAVRWHSKELFPFPADDIYIDWKILKTTEQEYILAVVAVPKKTIDPLVQALLQVGLKPLNLRPDASTITRLLKLPQDRHAIVTEVNRTVAYVTLVEGEKSVFTTVIPFTRDDTPTSYLHNIKLTIEEIKAYYKAKGVLSEESPDIVLTGEVASDQWIKDLPSPAKILTTPPRNPAFNKAYAVAISQLNRVPHAENINLLPQSMQDVYMKERTTQYYNAVLLRAVSIAGAYCIFALFVLMIIMVQKQDLDTNVKRLTNVLETSQQSSQNLLRVNATAKQIVTLAPLKKTPHEKINVFVSLVPSGIVITQWDYDDSKVLFNVSGIAKTRDDLLKFKSNLETSDQFTKILLPLSYLEAPRDINFAISFTNK